MKNTFNHRIVDAVIGNTNKKRKVKTEPRCSDHLTELWSRTLKAEKEMLRSKSVIKQRLMAVYMCERKEFDRECQKAKREHQRNIQYQIGEKI